MFGKNEIVGQSSFQDEDKLLVTSRFMTLQGEGPFRGKPAFFVRLAKCNLACSFCDTFFDRGDWFSFEDLANEIDSTIEDYYHGNPPGYLDTAYTRNAVLVFTGGEPMLQKALSKFIEYIKSEFANIQIESNGTVYQELPEEVTLVVSPKCLEKNGKAVKYLQPNKKVLERADCLKFVMSADPDSPYSSIPLWAFAWQRDTGKEIFISPMNIYNKEPEKFKEEYSQQNKHVSERSSIDEVISFWTPGLLNMESNQKNHEYAAKYCIQNGFTFNIQTHLYASLA